ncbi:hypothetical protein BOX15_Mlig025910g1 [Macrostomum lignano]|uniref:Adapter molecule Crk n=1 Tax=Macrostomum lignano TaxID=282301 RepID=A0A267G6T3_9PLAT|nr:hypothetical protein BOX15_Mlig025910g1 [Macrostomum lignano]
MNISLQQLGIQGTEDWFFGSMSRDRANEILLKESVGVFLIRASLSQPGGFALSVRDKDKTNHYKIVASKRVAHDGYKLKIGSNEFYSMTQLIDFYKNTKLADSVLTVPAAKPMYRAKFDFKVDPSDPDAEENLPLRRGDCVYYLRTLRDADGTEVPDWWHVVKRRGGESGLVPAIYLSLVTVSESDESKFQALRQLSFPFEVRVARERNPNIFDPNQLRLETGDIVEVQHPDEQQPEIWFGFNQRSKRQGYFPFNYVCPLSAPSKRLTSHSFSSMSTMVTQTANSSGDLIDKFVSQH